MLELLCSSAESLGTQHNGTHTVEHMYKAGDGTTTLTHTMFSCMPWYNAIPCIIHLWHNNDSKTSVEQSAANICI